MKKHVVVIGSGPGGYPAALRAAELGAEVTVIEKGPTGGVCLNCGCIPSKTLLHIAHGFETARALTEFSTAPCAPVPSWTKIIERKNAVVSKLRGGIEILFRAKKVRYIKGVASFLSQNEILVKGDGGEEKISFDAAIIAAGTAAFFPPPFDEDRDAFLDNKTIFEMEKLPREITIIGGGVIGCEFSFLFSALDVKVNLVELKDALLPGWDDGPVRVLTAALNKRGVNILTGRYAKKVEIIDGKKVITLDNDETLQSEEVMVAVGRETNIVELELENAGVDFDRKRIKVDPKTLRAFGNIYAVGDVNGLCLLAHAATRQGEVAAARIMGAEEFYNNDAVPKVVYSTPELAACGLGKSAALEKGYEVKAQKSFLVANGRAVAQNQADGFFQIVSEVKTGEILGVEIAAPYASEMIHAAAAALHGKMTVNDLKEIIFAHPAILETLQEAAKK